MRRRILAGLGLLGAAAAAFFTLQPAIPETAPIRSVRRGGGEDASALAILSPPGAGYDSTNVALYTTSGAPVTVTRTGTQYCERPSGSLVSVAANKPCVDYTGALLVEPGATNFLLQSDDITSASWATSTTPVRTANTWDYGTGSATGDTLADDDAAASESIRQVVAYATSGVHTFSAYLAAGSLSAARLWLDIAGGTGGGICSVSGLTAAAVRNSCTKTLAFAASWTASTAHVLGVTRRPTTLNGRYYEVTTAGATAATEPVWPTVTGNTVADGTVIWTDRGITSLTVIIEPGAASADTGSVKLGCHQLETGSVATSCNPTGAATASRGAQTTTVPTPAALSTTEGAARVCITPRWTGVTPGCATFLDFATTGAHAVSCSSTNYSADNGTTGASVAAAWTAGVRQCFRTSWSATRGTLVAQNLTTGANATGTGFTGFVSSGASAYIGSNHAGTDQALAALDSICVSSHPDGCR